VTLAGSDILTLLADIPKALRAKFNDTIVVVDAIIFGSVCSEKSPLSGMVILRNAAMAESFNNMVAIEYTATKFKFFRLDTILIKGHAEIIILDALVRDELAIKEQLPFEPVRYKNMKKGGRLMVILSFNSHPTSAALVDGNYIIKVPRAKTAGGFVKLSIVWAKEFLNIAPLNSASNSPLKPPLLCLPQLCQRLLQHRVPLHLQLCLCCQPCRPPHSN